MKESVSCYETSIVINPYLKIVNATIEKFTLKIGQQEVSLSQDEFYIPYNIDYENCASIKIGQFESKKMYEFNPFKNKAKDLLKIEMSTAT